MSNYTLTYQAFGTTAILIQWPKRIDESILQDIIAFRKAIQHIEHIQDIIIAYNSLTIVFSVEPDFERKIVELKTIYQSLTVNDFLDSKTWIIPVCYHEQFGLDLHQLSKQKKVSIERIIQLHSSPEYLVYFIGFQPGFLYLGGLNPEIHQARRPKPRLRVDKGSVGIGGEQTGIYPQDSSGGWNIIGKSPIHFFNTKEINPCFATAGDRVQFQAIDLDTFYQIEEEVNKGTYQLNRKSI